MQVVEEVDAGTKSARIIQVPAGGKVRPPLLRAQEKGREKATNDARLELFNDVVAVCRNTVGTIMLIR